MNSRLDVHDFQERERLLQCQCGRRFGQHRWGTYQCRNPQWRPGNGKLQWLTRTFEFRDASAHAVLP